MSLCAKYHTQDPFQQHRVLRLHFQSDPQVLIFEEIFPINSRLMA